LEKQVSHKCLITKNEQTERC